jgi:Cu(I)/Ag(I) efflux system membrane fusion protein
MKFARLAFIAIAAACGWFGATLAHRTTTAPAGRKVLFFQSPMHPWVKSEKPGQCTVCGMDLVPVYEGGASFDHAASGLVMLPQGSPNIMGVQTAEVKKQPLVRTLRVAGMIGEDESRHGVISAPVEGRLDGLAMNHEGQQVTRRQPLATMFSRTLLAAAEDYKTALAQGEAAAEAAKRRLEQHGLVWEQIKTIPQRQPDDIYFGMLAPLTGTIVKSYVHEGQYVKEGERMFEIADFSRMWFMFPVSEQDLPLVKVGQLVNVTTPSLPGETMRGRIAGISPNPNEMMRGAEARVVLENPERKLKNKSFAQGTVELESPEVAAIPRSAVLWPGNSPRVFVEKAEGTYEQRNVKLGRAGDSLWEVLDGLREGERVVVRGNMLIDSQAQLDAMVALPSAPAMLSPELGVLLHAAADLSAALAKDDIAAANALIAKLPQMVAGVKARAPVAGADIAALRKSFLPWSEELSALALKSGAAEVRVFRCSMTGQLWQGAPEAASWIQAGGEPRNPYFGAEMLECGTEVKR